MKLLRLATIAIICIGAVVLAYRMAYPSLTLRYRLTLEAEVDGQPKSGSGVIEVTYTKQPQIAAQPELSVSFRGEAVVLDLGKRGTLFALLKPDTDSRSGPEWIVLRAFDFPGGSLPRLVEEGIKQLRRLSGKRELPLGSLPMLVRFRDMNDPLTAERVRPDIAEQFGSGARLTRATLEIVPTGIWPFNSFGISGEQLTRVVQGRLSWLHRLNGGYIDGEFTSRNAPLGLHGGDFQRS
ncbi:hypothetical protein [Bradyrhizobium archetypum]|uniref:Uncharacterized protein n=1 Tax=Bradyrhizobium archetypum TaxID=2721160 RepID=A0A7Y4H561_9BRAD|nr:hypothetical protein [Bradyrhizobium archetypum]NOJ47816.1 hypothetical protein [Bradyrhizobium archetypum]